MSYADYWREIIGFMTPLEALSRIDLNTETVSAFLQEREFEAYQNGAQYNRAWDEYHAKAVKEIEACFMS